MHHRLTPKALSYCCLYRHCSYMFGKLHWVFCRHCLNFRQSQSYLLCVAWCNPIIGHSKLIFNFPSTAPTWFFIKLQKFHQFHKLMYSSQLYIHVRFTPDSCKKQYQLVRMSLIDAILRVFLAGQYSIYTYKESKDNNVDFAGPHVVLQ